MLKKELMLSMLHWFMVMLLMALIIILGVHFSDAINPVYLKQWLAHYGVFAPLIFIFLFIAATLLFIPSMPFCVAAGFMFGVTLGALYTVIGTALGSTLAFLIARCWASKWVLKHANKRLVLMIENSELHGWKFATLLRLVPMTPFNVLNYVFGVTKIPLRHFIVSATLATIPSAYVYSYLGHLGAVAAAKQSGMMKEILFAAALLAILSFLPLLISLKPTK